MGGIGSAVTYCFVVTNTGDTYLNDITIDDAELGINVTNLILVSGSQPLAPMATLVYYYESSITKDLLNTAHASGNPTDSQGHDLPGVPNPTDSDTARVEVAHPGLTTSKTVYAGHDSGASCPGTNTLLIASEIAVTFCFAATNTGNTYLNDITMVDDILGITEEDMILLSGSLPLAPGDTLVYYYETMVDQNMENTVKTCCKPTDEYGAEVPNVDDPCAVATAEISTDPSIPTLSEWGMILFIFMPGLTSIHCIRKRRTA